MSTLTSVLDGLRELGLSVFDHVDERERRTLADFLGVEPQQLAELIDDLGEEEFWHLVCERLRSAWAEIAREELGIELNDPELVAWLPTPKDDLAILEFSAKQSQLSALRTAFRRRGSRTPADLLATRVCIGVRTRPRERRTRRTARTCGARGDPSPDLDPPARRAA